MLTVVKTITTSEHTYTVYQRSEYIYHDRMGYMQYGGGELFIERDSGGKHDNGPFYSLDRAEKYISENDEKDYMWA